MATLPEEVKRRIVVELAGFRTTLEVAVILQLEYDLEIRPNDLCRYDATKDYFAGGAALAELFHATRRTFVHEMADIPIAHQAYRLRRLQRLSEAAERKGDYRLAARLVEQVAKEVGGHYTRGGQKVAPAARPEQMSASEARSGIVAFLKTALGRQRLEQAKAELEAEAAAAAEGKTAEPMAQDDASRPSPTGASGEAERRPAAPAAETTATAAPMSPGEARSRIQPYVKDDVERRLAATAAGTSAAAPPDRETGARTG